MTEPAITPLRQRMIEDMVIRRLAPGTCCRGNLEKEKSRLRKTRQITVDG